MLHRLGVASPVKTVAIICNDKIIERYEECKLQYAVCINGESEIEGFIIIKDGIETFYERPNRYEAIG